METASQNGNHSGGGGGGGGPGGLLRALRDGGSPRRAPRPADGPPEPAPAPVLSLDQIRATGSSNEYTEGPTVAAPPATAPRPGHTKTEPPEVTTVTGDESQGPRPAPGQRNQLLHNQRNTAITTTHPGPPAARDTPRAPPSADGADTRAWRGPAPPPERIIRSQPKRAELKQEEEEEELKPLTAGGGGGAPVLVGVVPGGGVGVVGDKQHAHCCRDCGRCVCAECVRPRPLPSCWMCGRRCVCSAQNVVEYGSCVCCVKGLFYHCSSDDEDTCADKPFSCRQPHCMARWSAVGLLALLLPCLLCYLPARGCLAATQVCYDRARRPGCRCNNAGCKCLALWRDT